MKVLYITGMYPTSQYPQKGIFCHEQVKALKQLGVDVDVVVPMTMYDKEFVKEWYYEGIKIKYIRFFKVPGTSFFEYTGYFLYLSLRYAKLDFKSYDIIHADTPLPTGDAIKRVSKKFNIPYVVHGHGLDVFFEESYKNAFNKNKIVKKCIQVYEDASAIVGVSQKVLDKISVKVNLKDKKFVVFNGVDIHRFYPSKRKLDSIITITSIGNLIPLKGHDISLIVIKNLIDKGYVNIEFILVGKGYLESELKETVKKLGIESYVKFLGYIPYEDIADLLRKSHIFILPSWHEALGCVYLEAMASGIPAIGCYNNGIDEIIINGKNGYLVHNKNFDELTACLEMLMNEDIRKEIGNQARSDIENNYLWINSAEKLLKIYEKLGGE